MEEFQKIKVVKLSKFNNAEHTNFMTSVVTYLDQIGVNIIGISPDILAKMKSNLMVMYDVVTQSKVSVETKRLHWIDNRRDNLHVHLLTIIRNAAASPIAEEQQAGILLQEQIKPYTGLHRLPNDQQTVQERALILDLSKPQYQEAITALRLGQLIGELSTVNEEYATLSMARNENKDAAKLPDSKSIRAELDKAYQYIADMAFVSSVSNPGEEIKKFINNINTAIDTANTAYNQRTAQTAKKA